MPINLITGLPGHGKGVFSLDQIEKRRKKEGRKVYYHNINELSLEGWEKLDDPKIWIDLPHGSIIVFDEAWQTFPLRPNAQKPPEYVAKLAIHRHSGYDIYIVTQQPSQLDSFVRKLIDKHYHIVRRFGAESANVHEFVGLNPNPQLSRKGSIKRIYKYPKEVYKWYKSAEVHTVTTKRPMRVYFLWFGVPPLLAFAIYSAFKILNPSSGEILNGMTNETQEALPSDKIDYPMQIQPKQEIKPEMGYIEARVPAIPDFPHTAPIYKEITKPINAPYPAMCIDSKRGCTCWSQQATKLQTSLTVCKQIVANGYFVDWNIQQAATTPQNGIIKGSTLNGD